MQKLQLLRIFSFSFFSVLQLENGITFPNFADKNENF